MNKITLAIIAMMTMGSATICAQDENPEQRPQQRRQMDRTEMLKNRTERVAKEYGLDEEQTAKLLDLNTRYADKLWQGRRGGPQMRDGRQRRGPRPDTWQQAQKLDTLQQAPRRDEAPQRGMMPNPEEMKKNMEAYEAELKEIMTEEQFAKWKADEEKRMQQGPRQRMQRPQRPTQRLQE